MMGAEMPKVSEAHIAVHRHQMGFGLGMAILVDATVVRCVMVPASMKLLGKWNWYLPSWLEWVPNVRFEPAENAFAPIAAPADD